MLHRRAPSYEQRSICLWLHFVWHQNSFLFVDSSMNQDKEELLTMILFLIYMDKCVKQRFIHYIV